MDEVKSFGDDIKGYYGRMASVRFYIYKSDVTTPPSEEVLAIAVKNKNTSCFWELPELFEDKKGVYDKLFYLFKNSSLKQTNDEMISLTLEEKKKWVKLSIKNKALPKYILDTCDIENNKYVLQLDEENLSISLLYTYLTVLRMMSDEIGFVKNMIVLIDTYHLDYCYAWLIASAVSVSNSNHNLISTGAWGWVPKVNNISGRIKEALELKLYLANPHKYDQRDLYTGKRFELFAIQHRAFSEYYKVDSQTSLGEINVKFFLTDKANEILQIQDISKIKFILDEYKSKSK